MRYRTSSLHRSHSVLAVSEASYRVLERTVAGFNDSLSIPIKRMVLSTTDSGNAAGVGG
jgi:hypothetical protein